jgi:hypothetical protein
MDSGASSLSHFPCDGPASASQLISLLFSNYTKYARKIQREEEKQMKIHNKTDAALFQTINTLSH